MLRSAWKDIIKFRQSLNLNNVNAVITGTTTGLSAGFIYTRCMIKK